MCVWACSTSWLELKSEMHSQWNRVILHIGSLNKLWISNQRTNQGLRILSYVGPRLWNSLPFFLAKSVYYIKNEFKYFFLIG